MQKISNISSEKLPYQRCLFQSIPEDAQLTLYNVTILVVLPLDTLLALMSVTCNSVILVAVLCTRSIQKPSLLLLCSLSMTDVIWAMISVIDNIVSFSHRSFCPRGLRGAGMKFVLALCFLSTLGHLAIIAATDFWP